MRTTSSMLFRHQAAEVPPDRLIALDPVAFSSGSGGRTPTSGSGHVERANSRGASCRQAGYLFSIILNSQVPE